MVLLCPHVAGSTSQEDPMSAFLFRLGRSSARHPFRVLGLWLVAAVAVVALQGAAGGQFDNSARVPGVESQHAADVLNNRFPSQGGQSARIVLHTDNGRLDDAAHAATVDAGSRRSSRADTTSPASPTRSRRSPPRSAPTGRRRTSTSPTRSTSSPPHNSTTPRRSPTPPAPAVSTSSSPDRWPSSRRRPRAAS